MIGEGARGGERDRRRRPVRDAPGIERAAVRGRRVRDPVVLSQVTVSPTLTVVVGGKAKSAIGIVASAANTAGTAIRARIPAAIVSPTDRRMAPRMAEPPLHRILHAPRGALPPDDTLSRARAVLRQGRCILPSHDDHATSRQPRPRAGQRADRGLGRRPGPLGSLLGRVTPVDQVGVEGRVDALKRRSIKKASKMWALDLAIRMMDLTTLEGKDTPGKIRAMCVKAMRPQPGDPTIPSVAAVCVYPALVAEAKEALKGSTVKVASVATGFPSGQTFRDIKIAETRAAVEAGADEIDMVIDRGAFLSGDYLTVFEEIVEVKEAAGEAHLKVILETGELETYDNVRRASVLAMAAGADFIKTSTGKVDARPRRCRSRS